MNTLIAKNKNTKKIIRKTGKVDVKKISSNPESVATITTLTKGYQSQLIYSDDTLPGFSRKKVKTSFQYFDLQSKKISSETILNRIKKLAVPPAYTDVWICADQYGHIQATARDARGRKQYRYHDEWQQIRSANKFDRLLAFSQALPIIRKRTQRDLKDLNLSRKKILASLIYLLDSTLIRIGNDEYARDNRSYGLTTLRNKHLKIKDNQARFHFNGKSGVEHDILVGDKRLVKILKQCLEIPGQNIFQYIDGEGNPHRVTSGDVNEYIKEISGDNFTAKDFRTWAACVLTVNALQEEIKIRDKLLETGLAENSIIKKSVATVVKKVAKFLGNTPAVCRSNYIHPAIFDAYSTESYPFNNQQKKCTKGFLNRKNSRRLFRLGEPTLILFLKKLLVKAG